MKTALIIIIGIGLIFLVGYWTNKKCQAMESAPSLDKKMPRLMSIEEFQEQLNKMDPENPIKVDGRLGPETEAKWQRLWCRDQARKTFTKH